MSPIYVNVPGGGLDSAGRGVAAAQQYSSNAQRSRLLDQEAAQRAESFNLEKDIALRTMSLKEDQQQFEIDQLAVSQEAEADALMAQAIESGVDLPGAQKLRDVARGVSPQFRQQMLIEGARGLRLQAEQAEDDALMAQIQNLEGGSDIVARIESGELRDRKSIKLAVDRMARDEARSIQTANEREWAIGEWQTWQADAAFDMPKVGSEEYEDVQKRLAMLLPGNAPRSDVKYREVLEELQLLTSRPRREAATRLVEEAMARLRGGREASALDDAPTLGDAAGDERFRKRVREESATEESMARSDASRAEGAAQARPVEAGPGKLLGQPMGVEQSMQINGGNPELYATLKDALNHLGFDEMPQPGEPGYEVALRVMAQVEARIAERDLEKSKTTNRRLERGLK